MPLYPEIPGHTLHVIQRGSQHAECFFSADDRLAYLGWLDDYARQAGCAVHAYALMGNHVHLLLTPSVKGGAGCLMHLLKDRHTRHVVETWQREGDLWEQSIDITSVHNHRYVLACMRYIELNPVRARMAGRPEQFPWSSHRSNALGEENALLTPHSAYAALGRSAAGRQAAYRAMFKGVRPGGATRRPDDKPHLKTEIGFKG
jgi:putative transposase